jgi:hypothetical protein
MLTKIYNFDTSNLFSVIEDLNIEDKHDLDLLQKLYELTNVFDQSNQSTVFRHYHDLLNECVYQLFMKMTGKNKSADKNEIYNILLRLTNN